MLHHFWLLNWQQFCDYSNLLIQYNWDDCWNDGVPAYCIIIRFQKYDNLFVTLHLLQQRFLRCQQTFQWKDLTPFIPMDIDLKTSGIWLNSWILFSYIHCEFIVENFFRYTAAGTLQYWFESSFFCECWNNNEFFMYISEKFWPVQ